MLFRLISAGRSVRIVLVVAVVLGVVLPRAATHADPAPDSIAAFQSGHAPFTVQFDDEIIPYRVMGVFVTPGAEVAVDVLHGTPGARYGASASGGLLAPLTNRSWHWYAPDAPGLYPITVVDSTSGRRMRLNAFVLTPFTHDRRTLDGYRIGRYRSAALGGRDVYERPDGFVRVTPHTKDVRVSPHFTLEQFLCKQTDALPQYALVRTRLLLKLERLLAAVNARGVRVQTLHVMSGFRTPYYNRSIGNTTDYSRHLYGGAADVFVDADGNGVMDDVNGDGRVSRSDAEWLAGVVRDLADADDYDPLTGGLGVYGPAPHRGPFIHVDARGTPARW